MKERRLYNRLAVCAIAVVMLGTAAYAQLVPVNIPDPNLRQAVRDALTLPRGVPITQAHMRQLKRLDATETHITDLAGLGHATHLSELRIGHNPQLSDLTPIAKLMELNHLDASRCNISDITPMVGLKNLTVLQLNNNYITDLSPLANLTQLTVLRVEDNQITDLNPLANLTQLTRLQAQNNQITDITPLANLTQLTILYLQHNRIVDVRPLASLQTLERLEIERNLITDHSPLHALSLTHFFYDQVCEMPPLPLEPRLKNRNFPSIVTRWGPQVLNRPDSSRTENTARHDLWFDVPLFQFTYKDTSNGFAMAGKLDEAVRSRDEHLAINPNMVFLVELKMREYARDEKPEDWPYWLRDANGDIVDAWVPEAGLVDFTHPGVQDRIVQEAVAVSKCGLFDGIFFDHGGESLTLKGYRTFEAEVRARENILRGIRAATRPNFLIMGNSGSGILPTIGPYMNGGFMETVVPSDRDFEDANRELNKIEQTLLWLDNNLREPRINAVEGRSIPTEAADSPTNLRWMRAFTALHLTHSDGYVLFLPSGEPGHYWYDFYDANLGRPVDAKAQLYDEEVPGLYIREFTNGWVVYNHSGAAQEINLPEEVISVESGLENTLHSLSNIDGGIYLKKTALSDTLIAEPIDAVPGAVLHLDASNNPGTRTRWVNLGTAGGRLGSSDRHDRRLRIEEGEIEIPAIGFSGRRQYYTATASSQIFGGPVDTNPQLYLGDWTLEFLCKRNGDLFFGEHQFAGFQNSPKEGLQGIRLRLLLDGRELELSIHADGIGQPTRALDIFLDENVWTWVTVVSINGESIIAYQDGVEVSRHQGVHFDANLPLDDISIGSNSYEERRRNFNGSFSIVRVYDRALSPEEVLQNIGATVIPIANPADVNGDGVVNILDLVVVAQGLGTDNPEADVNGDGVVNVFDLVQVAGAIGGGGAAPSASSPELSMISAAAVERWLAGAQGLGVGDANFQRGIRFLEGLLAALTPKETALLPNYPNPFNPETWIPYRLARGAEVAITIYDTKGTLVRRLALGNQAAGYYAERGKAAYWDGRNERGEAVASGIYMYQFRAGDYAASRRMVIVK